MTTKHHAEELDVVKLLVDLPEHRLRKGQEGTILLVFDDPMEHYLVEFADEEGVEIATVALPPEQVEVIWSFAEHRPKEDQTPKETLELKAKTYFEQGVIYLNNRLFDKAKEKFRRSIEIDSNYAGALMNLAKPLTDNARWDKAADIFRLVVSLQPHWQEARDNLAKSYLNLGAAQGRNKRYLEAMESFFKALEVDASESISRKAQTNISILYNTHGIDLASQDQFEEALNLFHAALQLSPDAEVRGNWALCLVGLATFKEITQPNQPHESLEEIYDRALQAGLTPSEFYNARGAVLGDYRKFNEAEEAFKKALELDPQNEFARKNLAQLQEWSEKGQEHTGKIQLPFDVLPEPQEESFQPAA